MEMAGTKAYERQQHPKRQQTKTPTARTTTAAAATAPEPAATNGEAESFTPERPRGRPTHW